jgi:hypothetical protein
MNAHEQRVEGEPLSFRHDDLAIENYALRTDCRDSVHELGEVPAERLSTPRAEIDVGPILECETPEAVPFGLVQPLFARWKLRD